MPRLILLNGPPGIGKSTIARRFVDDHPMALCLDLDVVRSLLGGWQGDPEAAGLRTRSLGLAMARTHLLAGHDVIVPQLLARLPFIESLGQVADEEGADFHEVVLLDERPQVVERFLDRSRQRAESGRPDEQGAMVEREGGIEGLEATYDRLMGLLEARPLAARINARSGAIGATYAELLACLEVGPRSGRQGPNAESDKSVGHRHPSA